MKARGKQFMKNGVAQTLRVGGVLGAWVMVAGACQPVRAAEMELVPSLSVSEEYNDNVYETATNKRSDYITRVRPGATLRYLAPRLQGDVSYYFEYLKYARNSEGDEYNHDASLRGTVTLVENFLFLDLRDTYRRTTLDVTRSRETESSLFLNQTDENNATISPYMLWRLGEKGTLKTGYRYTDVRYWGEGIDRREHGAFADFSYELTSKLSLTAGYGFTRLLSDDTDYDKHDAYGGFRYQYADNSFVYGQVGNTWQLFSGGDSTDYIFWNAGITHDFSLFTATFETRVENSSDPQNGSFGTASSSSSVDPLSVSTKQTSYMGRIDKKFERGSMGFSTTYTEYDDTQDSGSSRDKLALRLFGAYEIYEKLNLGLSVTGEHTDYDSDYNQLDSEYDEDYPYRLIGSVRLNYAFKDDLSLGLTYSYDTQLRDLDSTSDSIDVNRVILEVRKTF